VVSEFFVIEVRQSAAMAGFFDTHAIKDGGCRGEVLAKAFGEIGVHAFVFFFERYGEGQHFAFGQAVEAAHIVIVLSRL
jgi:hypothetical protein